MIDNQLVLEYKAFFDTLPNTILQIRINLFVVDIDCKVSDRKNHFIAKFGN